MKFEIEDTTPYIFIRGVAEDSSDLRVTSNINNYELVAKLLHETAYRLEHRIAINPVDGPQKPNG